MIRRLVAGLVMLAALFALVLAFVFPTEQLVRRGLAAVPLPPGMSVDFASASLRPWGLQLDGVVLRRFDGSTAFDAPWLRLRPSLLGLFGAKPGFPWTVKAALCDGDVAFDVDDDGATQALDAAWSDLDLGACLQRLGAPAMLAARASGSLLLRQARGEARPSGNGELAMRDVVWETPFERLERALLHADSAVVRWTLAGERLTFQELDVRGPDLELDAGGDVLLARSLGQAQLRLRVELTPMPGMPPELQRLLAGLPRRADGTYAFRLAGTPDVPRLEPP